MKIEILFEEFCNQYGDSGNILYLDKYIKNNKSNNNIESEIIYTSIHDNLRFLEGDIDIVYIGSLSETKIDIVLEKLKKHKEEIEKQIERGQIILATGNAFDLFGEYIIYDKRYMENKYIVSKDNKNTVDYYDAWITDEKGKKLTVNMPKIPEKYIKKGLGIYNTVAVTDMLLRHNAYCLAQFSADIKILGHKNTFTQSYPLNVEEKFPYMAKVLRGEGINEKIGLEGVRKMNMFSTYILGPILVTNPEFTQYLFNLSGNTKKIYLYEEMMEAYSIKLKEFEDPKRNI